MKNKVGRPRKLTADCTIGVNTSIPAWVVYLLDKERKAMPVPPSMSRHCSEILSRYTRRKFKEDCDRVQRQINKGGLKVKGVRKKQA